MRSLLFWIVIINLNVILFSLAGISNSHIEELKHKAENGDADALMSLAAYYEYGEDKDLALEYMIKAANKGNANAQWFLGCNYFLGELGLSKDFDRAALWYRKAAEQGYARAQLSLADMCYEGLGAKQDFSEAISWYRKSAEQGLHEAQFKLGDLYYQGQGVETNYSLATKWFVKSAEQGNYNAILQ